MTKSYPIARYTQQARDEVFAFLERVQSPPISTRLKAQWDWKYDANPLNEGAAPFLLLLRDGAALIGMIGAIPLCVAVRGQMFPITHSCDLAIAPAYRGQGLAEQLIQTYMSVNPNGFGWLNERSHRRTVALERSGWMRLTPLIRPLAPLPLLADLNRKRSNHLDSVAPVHNPTPLAFSEKKYGDLAISQISNFDERFDVLWREVSSEHLVIGVRDRTFLNWRYASRPDASYVILTASRGDKLTGYLVLRCVDRAGLRRGYFVDCLVHEGDANLLHRLIEAGISHLRAAGAAAIQCLVTTRFLRRALYWHGFLPWSIGPHPYFHARAEGPASAGAEFAHAPNWFLSMGDGDFEMSV